MSSGTKPTVKSIALRVVVRVARLFLRVGLSFGDFENLSRMAFCLAAEQHLRDECRKVSTARVAVTTGLSRAEVSRIRHNMGHSESRAHYKQRCERVLHGWHADPDFTDARGIPRSLGRHGRNSLEELVKKYSGDIPPRALIDELLASGAMQENDDSTYSPLRREFQRPLPLGIDPEIVADSIDLVFDAVLDKPLDSRTRRITVSFPAGHVPAHVLRTCHERIDRFLSALSHYLHASALTSKRSDPPSDSETYDLMIIDAKRVDSR
jgi:hypothetical protein